MPAARSSGRVTKTRRKTRASSPPSSNPDRIAPQSVQSRASSGRARGKNAGGSPSRSGGFRLAAAGSPAADVAWAVSSVASTSINNASLSNGGGGDMGQVAFASPPSTQFAPANLFAPDGNHAGSSFTSTGGYMESIGHNHHASSDCLASSDGPLSSFYSASSTSSGPFSYGPGSSAGSFPQPSPYQHPQYPQHHLHPVRLAADVVRSVYGNALKIESVLCKKLAVQPAMRDPLQRRMDQKLNLDRRSNVEALLAQVVGTPSPRQCKNCAKGHGPWTQCVVLEGQMCGSCANCWFNASGSRCTFHDNNHNSQPSQILGSLYPPPQPSVLPYPPSSPNFGPHQEIQVEIDNRGFADHAGRLASQAMGDSSHYTQRDRHLARIEAAAKELGMRIAKYDEYLHSMQGMAMQEQPQELGRAPAPAREEVHAPEACMDDSFSSDAMS